MSYRILHFSDLHLDMSFAGQGFSLDYGIERRLDLRATLTRVIAHARELEVNAVTIGGNLFVQEYLLPETANFIHQQFALLAPTRVIIAPGFLDPYINESPYARLNWPENVDIFYQGKLTQLELTPEIDLWGASNPPIRGHGLLSNFHPIKKVNLLLVHGQEAAGKTEIHHITFEEIQKAGFNIALLGGKRVSVIHPADKPILVYPGSPEPLTSSEENGLHQVVVIDIDGENLSTQPLSLQQWHYRTVEVDLTKCSSIKEAAGLIDSALEVESTKTSRSVFSLVLLGQPNFNLNIADLRRLIQMPAIFRIEDRFGLTYDLEQLAREQTVRGLLVRRFQERIGNTVDEFELHQQLTALRFALQALEGKQVSLYEVKAN